MRASDLPGWRAPYLLKALDEDNSAWNLVSETPIGRLVPSPDKKGFLPEEVTVIFADGTVRLFNPQD
jgi:hypothetical protein